MPDESLAAPNGGELPQPATPERAASAPSSEAAAPQAPAAAKPDGGGEAVTRGEGTAPPPVKAKPRPKPKPPAEPKIPVDLGLTKSWPWSEGLTNQRKKKPPLLAVINENCTGCAGSPVCIIYCPVEECMFWVDDEENPPFGRIEVDYQLCIGCKLCIAKGPDDTFLDGCPWDAIDMVATPEVEQELGVKFNY